MKTSSNRRVSIIAVGLAALLGITACGSDEKKASTTTSTSNEPTSDSADAGSDDEVVSTESDLSIPAAVGLSDDCAGYYQLFALAFAGDTAGVADADKALAELEEKVPEDLQDDFALVSSAVSKLIEVSKKYEDNPTQAYQDPEVLAVFGDPKFTEASTNVNTWLSTECPQAGG